MERPTKVIPVSDTPPAPQRKSAKKSEDGILAKQKEQLQLSPEILVVDNSYPRQTREQSLKSAKAAMYQLNSGQRKAFPSDTYYAIWRWSPDDGDVAQLLVGLRSHMKEEWRKLVERAGSRKKGSSNEEISEAEAPVSDDPFGEPAESGGDVE